jgi:hypothetical protein
LNAAIFKDGNMSSIATALQSISTHRELVAAYYHRPTSKWIITGTSRNNGGAVVLDDSGKIEQVFSSKIDALSTLLSN